MIRSTMWFLAVGSSVAALACSSSGSGGAGAETDGGSADGASADGGVTLAASAAGFCDELLARSERCPSASPSA
jgi:hypothetical protein